MEIVAGCLLDILIGIMSKDLNFSFLFINNVN